jgi:pyruvate/2-oxoglutarate/acetoin dehydrogenase E1 component
MYKDTCTIIVTAISSRNPNFLLENKKLYQPSTENEERKLAP